jgi:hypothetical protein
MPVPDFSPGEVLTAAAMDSIGLWLVKSQTIGTGVASQEITSCFSSDFSSYRVVVSNVSSSASNNMLLQLLDTTTPAMTNYQYGIPAVDYAANSLLYARGQNATSILIARGIGSQQVSFSFDVLQPKSAAYTFFMGISYVDVSTGYAGIGAGMHQTATAYDGFKLTPSTGTLTGGTIRVYGYRN